MLNRTTTRVDRVTAPRAARITVLFGPDKGLEVSLPPTGIVVGAQPACDLVLKDPAVSSRHCSIRSTPKGFEVRDLGSRNGTVFDGAAIERALLPPGAVLRLGTTLLLLAPEEQHVALAPSARTSFGDLLGESAPMRRVYSVLERVSAGNAPVLVYGESGTGKELCGRAIHEHSDRKNGPFVIFDASAASETLLESDLFGHVRGAFTGAERDRTGAFAAAHKGTLFIDEIGELPLRMQPKLLRMLETGEVQPLGGNKHTRYDVRVVAATHRDLADEVAKGTFRGDVYFRLAVVEVHLPPLRERPADIARLVEMFLAREGARVTPGEIAGPNLDRLEAYAWPGNVRELRNVIARAVALGDRGAPFAELPVLVGTSLASRREPEATADRAFSDAKAEIVERFEKSYLRDLLARHGDNLAHAARVADIERKHLYRLLEKHGLRADKAPGTGSTSGSGSG
ncbi:MAG: sigma 54-dependent Fis family transcriptional regulator [Polyangiaceae bacterium]|nr:sigma 54-dependent Fis family transcriptional regulator [Polyangiaceae bacterium]